MTQLNVYPEYKDSGVEWLGDVPVNWELLSIKHLVTYNDEVLPDSTSIGTEITYIEISDVDEYSGVQLRHPMLFGDAPSRARRVVRQGDVLVSTVRTYLRAIAAVESDRPNLIASTGFAVLRAFNVDASFLRYAMLSRTLVDQIIGRSVGVSYPAINASDLVRIALPVPSRDEQRAIASFLDDETSEIDAFIADQQELIRLLHERRAATITRAVTKGLDVNVPLKSSNVEWFGEIPSHWVVKGLRRFISKVDQGVSPEASAELADGNSVGVLKAGCVNGGNFVDTEHKRLPDSFSYEERLKVSVGDLIVNRASGSPSLVGSAALVRRLRYNVILSDKTFRLRPNSSCLPAYLERVLNSAIYRMQVRAAISGAEGLANNLPISALRRFAIPAPPLTEQQDIVDYLDRETAEIDAAIADAKEAIELSKERRAALISAAVTGKIDVRDHPAAKGAA